MKSSEDQNSSSDVTLHREIIDTLRESLDRSEREAETLRDHVRSLSTQNTDLSQQNVQLTYVLVAPKEKGSEDRDVPRSHVQTELFVCIITQRVWFVLALWIIAMARMCKMIYSEIT